MNATDRLLIETRDNALELETGIHMVLLSSLLMLLQSQNCSNFIEFQLYLVLCPTNRAKVANQLLSLTLFVICILACCRDSL